jgi:hypothetical protein
MAGGAKDAWDEVGEHFSDLGHRLSERYRALGDEGGEDAEESRKKIEEAVRGLTQQLDRTFTSVGDTMRDPEAKQSLAKAVSSLGIALSASFSEAGEEIRKRFGSASSSDAAPTEGASPPAGEAPGDPSAPASGEAATDGPQEATPA